jgi:hypothetical protein
MNWIPTQLFVELIAYNFDSPPSIGILSIIENFEKNFLLFEAKFHMLRLDYGLTLKQEENHQSFTGS